jgi:hypothetical protein
MKNHPEIYRVVSHDGTSYYDSLGSVKDYIKAAIDNALADFDTNKTASLSFNIDSHVLNVKKIDEENKKEADDARTREQSAIDAANAAAAAERAEFPDGKVKRIKGT